MYKYIHTSEGKLELDCASLHAGAPLSVIELDNEEELLEPWQWYIEKQRASYAPQYAEYVRETILNYYRRLKKHGCEEIIPLYLSQAKYFRAGVRYPDGTERRWWAFRAGPWSTNGATKSGRIKRRTTYGH